MDSCNFYFGRVNDSCFYIWTYIYKLNKKMRKYLFILICLPLFAQVPDTNTFSFTDVKDEIENNGGATTNSLVDAFTNANDAGFDPAYEGSKNALLNFRNYTHLGGLRFSGKSFNFTGTIDQGRGIYFKSD